MISYPYCHHQLEYSHNFCFDYFYYCFDNWLCIISVEYVHHERWILFISDHLLLLRQCLDHRVDGRVSVFIWDCVNFINSLFSNTTAMLILIMWITAHKSSTMLYSFSWNIPISSILHILIIIFLNINFWLVIHIVIIS